MDKSRPHDRDVLDCLLQYPLYSYAEDPDPYRALVVAALQFTLAGASGRVRRSYTTQASQIKNIYNNGFLVKSMSLY
jgi:hypothetical protein